jgi:hypothetical protein
MLLLLLGNRRFLDITPYASDVHAINSNSIAHCLYGHIAGDWTVDLFSLGSDCFLEPDLRYSATYLSLSGHHTVDTLGSSLS